MLQQQTDEVMESEDGSVEFETPTDDEEITVPSQDKYRKVPDIPDSDIHDEQTLSNTNQIKSNQIYFSTTFSITFMCT